ncbi:hypothetical protein D3C80_1968750 [compost metagenome]
MILELLCDCINETIRLESTPPDRNAPSGTSAIICDFTAADSLSPTTSTTSLSLACDNSSLNALDSARDQYETGVCREEKESTVR